MEISLYQIMFILENAACTYAVYRILGMFYEEQNKKKEERISEFCRICVLFFVRHIECVCK